jgi:WD40 repeat protein
MSLGAAPSRDLQMVGEVSGASSWQQTKTYAVGRMQTDSLATIETEAQTVVSALQSVASCEKGQMASSVARGDAAPQARIDGLQYVYQGSHYNPEDVAQFLADSQDGLLQALASNTRSTAFDSYEPNWVEKRQSVSLSMALVAPFLVDQERHITGLSWNASGSLIAAGYGRVDTVAWCAERGYVAVWNISKRDLEANVPHFTLETDSYVTAVSFHPTQSYIIAVGTYNGEILLWNLSEKGNPSSSLACANTPREPITKLQWLQNMQEPRESHRYILCSASQEGKVMFWLPSEKLADARSSYEVQNKKRQVVGVLSMSFARSSASTSRGGPSANVPGLDNLMLLGVETGEVFRTKPGVTAARQGNQLQVESFDPHRGPVHAVDCSPFFRNLFLTCSSDGSAKIFNSLERTALMELEPSLEIRHYIYAAQFSPFRPSVLVLGTRSSHLHIYDLEHSRTKPALSVEAGTDGSAVLAVAFNQADPTLIATGDLRGGVRLWLLASELTQMSDLERLAVKKSESSSSSSASAASPKSDGSANTAAGGAAVESDENDPIRQLFGFTL